MTLRGVEEAKLVCETPEYQETLVLVIYLPDVHESVAGIIAGRIREQYHKPTFILTDAAEGVKGSGRSIEAYAMYEELCKCKELLTKFGGHPMAAGLSLKKENVKLLRKRLNEQCTLKPEDLQPKIYIDVPMPMDYVTKELVQEFELLAPFGKDNERPIFADKDLNISRMWVIGKNKNVLRLSLVTAAGTPVSGIYYGDIEALLDFYREKFGKQEVELALHGMKNKIKMAVIYQPTINSYRGNESLQFEIRSFC
jgi:single-stranded-DNA-specific exonuclease